ncbi:MAG: PAS domain-containing protein, partial [Desulfobacterales bacterium]
MKTALTWILLILIALGGIYGTYALSEAFRADARKGWEAEASQAAQWLSSTILGWLEESYAPLSGLAILFENSSEVSEVEFLGATDGLEGRATAFFLDAKAVARPQVDGPEWSIDFSNDPLGPLSPDTPLSRQPEILDNIKVAVDNPDQVMLGPPFSAEHGARYSPAALAIQDARGQLVVIGLVNFDAIVKGLFNIHQLDGLQLHMKGRFKEPSGLGSEREIIGEPLSGALHSVTTRTVSAGADLSITWYMNEKFRNGPKEHLALLTLWSGIAGTLIIAAFIAFFIQRNHTITRRVQEATGELKKVSEAVEQSPVSVVITAKDGTIEYVNPTFSEVTGYSPDEAIGQNPRVLKSGDLPESYYKELWDTILAGKVWRGEFKNKRKNGEEFWESASISPIKNEEGEITHFVAVKEDITEQKQIEEALRASEEKSRLLLESVGEGIFGVDLDGRLAFINPAANRMLGYGPEELIGDEVHKKIHHSHADGSVYLKDDCPMYLTYADGAEHQIADEVLWRKDGSSFPVEYTSMPIKKDGQVVGAVVTFMDITERKKAEEEAAHAAILIREKEAQLSAAVNSMVGGIFMIDKNLNYQLTNEQFYEL